MSVTGRFLLEDGSGFLLLEDGGGYLLLENGTVLAFPDVPSGVRIEVNAGGIWTDLTSRLDHGTIVIGRGHPDESATVSPSTIDMQLTNSDAALSPDNPQSVMWPWLVQNIPGRISLPEGASYLRIEQDQASGMHSGNVSVFADLDVQLDCTLDSEWTQGAALAAQWVSSGNDRCWFFALNPDGTLQWGMTTGGTMGTYQGAASTLPVAAPPGGRMSARVTWNHATGVVTFYTSATALNASPSWTQLGTAVTLAAASPLPVPSQISLGFSVNTDFSAYEPYFAPWPTEVNQYPGMNGKYHGFLLKSGSTVIANPDFTVQSPGTSPFTDSAGVTWTIQGTALVSDRDYRCHAELTEWPQDEPELNPPGGVIDATVQVQGGGLLRRYSQRNRPVDSAVTRACRQLMITPGLAACWPMEDGAGSASIADITGSGRPMTWTGTPKLASNSDFPGANPLPVLNGAQIAGRVAPYAPGWTDNVIRLLVEAPMAGDTTASVIASVRTSGTVARADLTYGSTGTIALALFDATGASLASTGSLLPFGTGGINGQPCRIGINLQASGGNVKYWIEVLRTDGIGGNTTASASIAGTVGAVLEVALNPGGLLLNTVIGGITVQPLFTTIADTGGALAAWPGEPAGLRFQRLCAEEGIQFRGRGNLAATTLMGVQTPQTLAALLQACADADLGVWTELRRALGWGYVTRQWLYNQLAMVAVDYHQDHLSPWTSAPQRDDQQIINDVTCTNANGSSARQFAGPGQPITGGRFAVGSPGGSTPSAGTYDQSFPVAIANDSDLNNLAGWKLHLGTVDGARFPGVVFDLSNRTLAAAQYAAVLAMDLGHRFTIANPPLRWGTSTVTQLAQQLTETISAYDLEVAACGVPELPYEVFSTNGSSRISTDGTTLTTGVSATATSLSFTTAAGFPLWTTAAGDFPFDAVISGERITVTGIGGGSSPQVAQVIRSVNGVVKAQLAGAAVNVWPAPAAIGL